MTRAVQSATCALCGEEFDATVRFALVSRYCSDACRNEANRQTMVVRGIALEPSEKKPIRKEPMTNVEMEAYLLRLRQELDSKPQLPNDRHWRLMDAGDNE